MTDHGAFPEIHGPAPEQVEVRGWTVRRGSRVRLRPRAGGDVMDGALVGRTAVVEGLDQDDRGRIHVAVTLDDDPGRDLGLARWPGHRFFFAPEELEPLPQVLIAGVGNVFLGDDGFGVAVARRLLEQPLPPGVLVRDVGIRGLDLAYALDGCDAAILVDAVRRGHPPGTVLVIDPVIEGFDAPVIEPHRLDLASVLSLARAIGRVPSRLLLVGCEPAFVPDPERHGVVLELRAPVADAVDTAVREIRQILAAWGVGTGTTERKEVAP